MARRLPPNIYHHPLLTALQRAIEKYALLVPQQKVLVGLSGGADSVALLIALSLLDYECIALHCNFHLRGEDSNADEAFCRDLCSRYSIPFSVREFDTEQEAKQAKVSIEMVARDLRYRAFEEQAHCLAIKNIAVAHHLQDNVETLLGNIALGTGLRGLKGIPIRRGNIIRPFLEVDPKYIYNFLNVVGENYRTDHTNQDTSIRRNYIRHNILPLFQQLNPNFLETVQRLFENLREAQSLYQQGVQQTLQKAHIDTNDVSKEEYLCTPIASSQASLTLLYELLSSRGFHRNELEKFALHLCDREPATIYSSTHRVTRSFGKISISNREKSPSVLTTIKLGLDQRAGKIITPYGELLYTFFEKAPMQVGKNIILIDVSSYPLPPEETLHLELAIPNGNTKIKLLGLHGQKEIKKILREHRLSAEERTSVPLLSLETTPIWLMPYTRTDALLVKESTTQVLMLELIPPTVAKPTMDKSANFEGGE